MKTLATVLVTPLLLAGGAAFAQEPPLGFFAGATISQSRFDADDFDVEDIDDEDITWKIIAGYRFHRNLGAEASYVDFGETSAPNIEVSEPFNAQAKGFSAFGVGYLPLGAFDLFAKAGVAMIDSEGNTGAVLFEDDDTEFAWGAGAQWRIGNLAIRAEYEQFETDIIGDLDLISLGATYTFAAR